MSKYSKINYLTPSAWQLRRLKMWLDEWGLEQKLRNGTNNELPVEEEEPSCDSISPGIAKFDSSVAVGQIRLLSPKEISSCPRLLYFAVIADWAEGIKLVAPYGNFSEPASPGELLTGRSDLALRVLCLWNSHTLPTSLIAESWVVDRMQESELDEAWAIFEHVTFGKPLPAGLVERVGPPISHPRDPRRQYQQEEMDLMAPLKEAAIKWSEIHEFASNVIVLQDLAELVARHKMTLAAAESRGSLADYVFWTHDKQTKIIFRVQGNGKTISVTVWDSTGEPSNQLDGFMLRSAGQLLATISDGVARVPVEHFFGEINIKDVSGREVLVIPEL